MRSPILSNVNGAYGHNGCAHPDHSHGLHHVHARSEDGLPASVLVDPRAYLKSSTLKFRHFIVINDFDLPALE